MRPSFRRSWVVTGLALLGAMIVGGREAQAGITITGGFTPVTPDPVYEYIFTVYLNSNINDGDSFTIENLAGVTSASNHSEPSSANFPFAVSWVGQPGDEGIKWTFTGSSPINHNTTPSMGPFTVETLDVTLPSQTPSAGTQIHYSYTLDGQTSSDSFTLQNLGLQIQSVPEPSSSTIVLLTGGTAAVFGLVVRARRRRLARTA